MTGRKPAPRRVPGTIDLDPVVAAVDRQFAAPAAERHHADLPGGVTLRWESGRHRTQGPLLVVQLGTHADAARLARMYERAGYEVWADPGRRAVTIWP